MTDVTKPEGAAAMLTTRRAAALLAAAGSVVLAPVLLAGPAFADETPLPDEPPGGATCAPDIPADDCQQEEPAPTPTPKPTQTQATPGLPATGGKPAGSGSSSGSSGSKAPTLAHTGASDTGRLVGLGSAGALVLVAGAGLVAVGRHTARA
ncbi:MAG: hypothetical protein LCI03_19615 [Actinobacteria bacterium]|nr:hypothetical protein [Actinomycetota bacterium]